MQGDLRFAFRILRRFKLYAIAATMTLAIAIAATTGVFSVIDATLLRPLPYRDSHRLVALNSGQSDPSGREESFPLSQIELVTWRTSTTFEGIEAVESRTVSLTGRGDPEVLTSGAVTSGFFRLLGVEPAIGRMFSSDEERGKAGVVVLAHSLWVNRFNGDLAVLGQTIVLGGRPHTVIGVMPRDLRLVFDRSTVWTPLNPVIDPARTNIRLMFAIGRLKPRITVTQAQSELATLSAPLATQYPVGHSHARPVVQPLQENLYGQRASALWMLGVAVLGLLALACANVVNLTLGHLSMRQGELATRSLVGAGAGRILRLLVIQTAVVALAGGAIGLGCVGLALPPLIALYNADGLGVVALTIDWRVLVLSGAVISGTVLLCTGVPAWKIHRASARGDTLRMAGGRFSAGRWERSMRAMLVSTQVAIAVALLCASGALMKSLNTMLGTMPGFTAERVMTMQMLLPPALYPDLSSRARFVQRMLERVSQVPGVLAAGTTQSTFLPNTSMRTLMHVEGIHRDQPERSHIRHITPGYFDALRVPIVEGRGIDSRDQAGFPPVCMVSHAFAKKYFPGGSAVGRRVRRAGSTVVWMTIVGVAGDVRDDGLVTEPGPLLYVPYLQLNTPTARISLVARTQTEPAQMAASIRQAIWQVDRNQPIDRIASLEDVLLEGASAERFRTLLVGMFAVIGLLLAVVGVYAVTSAAVTARTFEASVRLALGARPWSVAGGMVRDFSTQIIAGVVLGLGGFYLSSNLLSSLLFQTAALDTAVIAGAASAMALLAFGAAGWQSRRLARVSPALGLRGLDGTGA